jgi:hypothetical protein
MTRAPGAIARAGSVGSIAAIRSPSTTTSRPVRASAPRPSMSRAPRRTVAGVVPLDPGSAGRDRSFSSVARDCQQSTVGGSAAATSRDRWPANGLFRRPRPGDTIEGSHPCRMPRRDQCRGGRARWTNARDREAGSPGQGISHHLAPCRLHPRLRNRPTPAGPSTSPRRRHRPTGATRSPRAILRRQAPNTRASAAGLSPG